MRLLESVTTAAGLASSDMMAAVQSVAQFEKLRGDLIKDISGSPSLAGPLESGAIELSRVEAAVDAILARNIPEWFGAARDAAAGSAAAFVNTATVMEQLGDSIDRVTKRQKILRAAMSEMGNPVGNGGISADTVKSIQDALSANEKLTDYVTAQNGVLKLNAEAWNNRTFGDIRSQIDALRETNSLPLSGTKMSTSGYVDNNTLLSLNPAVTTTYYAQWTAKNYPVNWEDGDDMVLESNTVDYGQNYLLPASNPTKPGYLHAV